MPDQNWVTDEELPAPTRMTLEDWNFVLEGYGWKCVDLEFGLHANCWHNDHPQRHCWVVLVVETPVLREDLDVIHHFDEKESDG